MRLGTLLAWQDDRGGYLQYLNPKRLPEIEPRGKALWAFAELEAPFQGQVFRGPHNNKKGCSATIEMHNWSPIYKFILAHNYIEAPSQDKSFMVMCDKIRS